MEYSIRNLSDITYKSELTPTNVQKFWGKIFAQPMSRSCYPDNKTLQKFVPNFFVVVGINSLSKFMFPQKSALCNLKNCED